MPAPMPTPSPQTSARPDGPLTASPMGDAGAPLDSQTFGCITVMQLPIGFRFARKGAPGLGPSKEWMITCPEQMEEMELRARGSRRPASTDLLAAIRWAVAKGMEAPTE